MRWLSCLVVSCVIATSAVEKEPLENHVALFNEMDTNLRTADPSLNATNHIVWVRRGIEAKRDLRLRKEIEPWLKDLAASCSNDWRVLRAVAADHDKAIRYYYHSLLNEQRTAFMDRAYRLARADASQEELSRMIDDYITCLFPDGTNPRMLDLKHGAPSPDQYLSESEMLIFGGDAENKPITEDLPDQLQEVSIDKKGLQPPAFPTIPSSYESATNDGEIIRWLLANKPASGYVPLEGARDWDMTSFAAAYAGTHYNLPEPEFDHRDSQIDEDWRDKIHEVLASLEDHQSVVWGNKGDFEHLVVELPEDYRYISAYKARAAAGDEKAAAMLGNIYVNRGQLERAITWYTRAGRTNEVGAIQGNQGRLTRHLPQCAGKPQTINYIFRNGSTVDCSIHPINQGADLLPRMIAGEVMGSEMKLLEGSAGYFHEFNIAAQDGVVGPAITNWPVALPPTPHHFDTAHGIEVPALDAGFYLLRANMHAGNTSETVLHVYDTLLISADFQNRREDNELLILCDARTGEPRANEPLHFIDATEGIKEVDRENGYGHDEVDGPVTLGAYELMRTNLDGLLTVDRTDVKHGNGDYWRRDKMGIIAFAERTHPFLPIKNTTKLSAYDPTYRGEESREPKFFVTTDRPVYRPGDTGHLKFWIPDGKEMIAPNLRIEHTKHQNTLDLVPTTNTNEYDEVLLDEYRGAEFQFTISEHASLGTYEIKREGDYSYNYGQHPTFRVEEYRAPELLLSAAFTGDGRIELRATHTYGEPLAGGTLQGGAQFQATPPIHFHPPAPLDPAWGKGYWWNGNQFNTNDDTDEYTYCWTEFDIELNQEGIAYIDIPAATNGPAASATTGYFSIGATLTDSKGKQEAQSAEAPTPCTVLPKLSCWLDRAFFAADDSITCHVAHGPRLVPARVEIRDHSSGAPAQSIRVTQKQSVRLAPLQPGNYEALLISRDGQQSRPFQFAVGAPQATGLTAECPVRLVIEKGLYNKGDTARVLIQVDQPGRFVYLFPDVSSRSGFCEPQVIHMEHTSHVAEIELRGEGTLRCAALTVIDGKTFMEDRLLHIRSPELDAGKVELTPNKKRYTRGEEVALNIKTTAADGAPRPCSVTLTVYNSALDRWAPVRKTSIIATLFSTLRDVRRETINVRDAFGRPLSAITPFWAMRWIAPKGELPFLSFLEHSNLDQVSVFGSAMSVGEAPLFNESTPPTNLKVREDFRDLAYWNATILTDSNGHAEVTFPMPDGLMKWKIQAWAMHTNYAATATTSIECAQDFVAHLHTPRFIREGDELTLTSTIRNHTNCVLEHVATSIEAKGLDLTSSTRAKIEGLNPGVETNIYWDLTATTPGEADIVTKAWSPAAADGMKKSVPVLPRGMLKRGGRAGVLAGAKTVETIPIYIPAEIDPATLEGQLNVTPNMLDALANALPFLEEYPHDCAEQTLNKFLSSIVIARTIEELEGTIANRDDIIERATMGYEKLMDAANYRGDWGWNLDDESPSDPFISAWIVRGMRICDASHYSLKGCTIVPRAAKHMLSIMEKRLESASSNTNTPSVSNLDALQVLVVSEFDFGKDTELLNILPQNKKHVLLDYSRLLLANAEQLSLYGKVLLALAFELQGDAENRDKLLVYIEQYLERDTETGAAWLRTGAEEFWFWYNDDIETQAWYLKLLNCIDPHGERAAGVARHLMLNRVYGDHWKSTRDTSLAIEALAEFATNNHPKPGTAKPEITLNGVRVEDPAAIRLVPGSNTLTISSPTGAPLFHDVTWSYYTKENPITAEGCELVTIERSYFRAAEKKKDRVEIQEGEAVAIGERIEVELTIHASQRLEYLLAEDFKPAGFETFDQYSGYRGGAYRELHDERVSFYLHAIRKGETRLSYEMRAEFPGTLSAHPATIELMYAPRQAANTKERTVRVLR